MTDVLERLRAADPLPGEPDAPPVEWMLARLEPPRRRASRRPLAFALAGVAGLAAAVAIVGGSSSPDVVAEASEALASDGAVVHTVWVDQQLDKAGEPVPKRKITFSRKPKRIGFGDVRFERWSAQNPRRERVVGTIFAADGKPDALTESAYADGVYHLYASWMDDGVRTFRVPKRLRNDKQPTATLATQGEDPVADIRTLLADKELTPAGETVVGGRTLLSLRGKIPSTKLKSGFVVPEIRVEYLVDPETYEPVRIDQRPFERRNGKLVPTGGHRVTFKTYERLPLTPSNLALLKLQR